MCSAGQICFNSQPFAASKQGALVGIVHQDAALHDFLTLREALEVQLHHGTPALGQQQRRAAAGHLLELLGLQPIQSVLLRHLKSAGDSLKLNKACPIDSSLEQSIKVIGFPGGLICETCMYATDCSAGSTVFQIAWGSHRKFRACAGETLDIKDWIDVSA